MLSETRKAEIRRNIQAQFAQDKPDPVRQWSPAWEKALALSRQMNAHAQHVAHHRKQANGRKAGELFCEVQSEMFQAPNQ